MRVPALNVTYSVRAAVLLVTVISIIHFMTLGFTWNFIDSFALLSYSFVHIVPQHTPLYPLILEFFRLLFNFNDNGAVLVCTVILQQLVFLFTVFQFLQSVRLPVLAGAALCFLYPIFIVQNGIFTEALFTSFLLLLLSTSYRAYRTGYISFTNQLLFCVSILGLSLTRHVGILYAVLPVFIAFNLSSGWLTVKWRTIAIQASFIILPLITSPIIKSGFETLDVPMYGRPGMHVIEKILNENPERRSVIIDKWMANAQDADELMAQEIISDTERGGVWLVPRMEVAAQLRNKYAGQDSLWLEIRTEELLNSAFSNMMLTGDAAIVSQCVITFKELLSALPTTSFSLIHQDIESKESGLFKDFNVFRVHYPQWLTTPIYWFKYCFSTLHYMFSLTILSAIIYGALARRLSRFSWFLLFLLFVQLVVHSVFTVSIPRYSIHLELTLFFVFLDLVESHFASGRLKTLLPFSKGAESQAELQSQKTLYDMVSIVWETIRSPKSWKAVLVALSLIYVTWEVYWYNQVGFLFIKWHTHFGFLLLLYLLFQTTIGLFGLGKKSRENVQVLFIGLFLTEAILMGAGWTKTRSEKLYNIYVSPQNMFNNERNYYGIDEPHGIKTLHDEEFSYTRKINSHGYSDAEWSMTKKPSEFRILCVGDSFTEGDGAHEDSSYVSFLRRKLQVGSCPIMVMNAGKCGSDPFFNFVNYRDRLTQFNPDIIIQTISQHDMTDDLVLRGGMERFGEDSSLTFQKQLSKEVEFLYAVSYTGRIIFKLLGYNELLVSTRWYRTELPEVESATVKLFKEYSDLARRNGSQMLIVFLPSKHETNTEYPSYFKSLLSQLKGIGVSTCDLREYYRGNTENIDDYFWVQNGHHNANGYELMSDGIFNSLKANGLLKTDSTCAE